MKLPRFIPLVCFALAASVSAQTSLNLSTDLVRLGIAASNMTPNSAALDSGPLLESGVRYAANHQITSVVATTGAYYFLSGSALNANTHVLINGINAAMTIDLQGSDLYFAHPEKFGLFVTGLTGVTIQNFTVDFLQQRYTQLTVTGVNAALKQVQYAPVAGWQTPTALAGLNSVLVTSGAAPTFAYVFRNGQPIPSFARLSVQTPFTDTAMTLASTTGTAAMASIRVGDVVVLTLRAGGVGMLVTNTTSTTIKNVKIFSGSVGLRSVGTTSTTLDHVEVIPRPGTDRLVSTVEDGISPSQPGLNNVLQFCRAVRTLDDGFSPNTWVFGSVQSLTGTRVAQLQGDANTAFNGGTALPNGSTVAFERASDGAVLGTAVVVSQSPAAAVGGLPQLVVTFDRDLPGGVAGTWAYATDPSLRGGNFLLERNTVQQQGWARGISVWGLISPTLHGNYLHRTSMAGVAIMHQLFAGDWHVPPVTNLSLVNNVIEATVLSPDVNALIELGGVESVATSASFAPMSGAPHQNLQATQNFLGLTGRTALWVGNMTGGTVDGNYLFKPANNPNLGSAYPAYQSLETQPLVVQASTGVTLGTNPVDTASGRMFVTNTGYAELAAYAPGSTLRLNAYNLGGLAGAATITLTDADAKIWNLGVAASGTHAIDVTIPAGAGLGGAVVALTAGGQSYFGTLYLDSQDNIPTLNQSTFLISPSSLTAPAQATTLSFLVVTQGSSAYGVSTSDPFVSAGSSGSAGTGVVTVNLAANAGSARSTVIEIAGEQITLTQAGAADPVVTTAPASQTAASGANATFSVTATGAQSYQWYFDGTAITGATGASYTVSEAAAGNAGTYTVTATNSSGSAQTAGAYLTVGSPPVSRLVNLSIGTNLSSASPMLTMGTVVGGSGTSGNMGLLFRAAGPSLSPLGVPNVLPDPQLTVFGPGGVMIGYNDNWGGTAALNTVFNLLGAFPFVSASSKDAAYFNPANGTGLTTVQVTPVGTGTGFVIAEIYDSTPTNEFAGLSPRLINVSVLKSLAPGEVLTAGFYIGGTASKQVLIRADGPSLGIAPFNLPGTMVDPAISLYDSKSNLRATNDNWGTPVGAGAATAAQLSAAFGAVGAFTLQAGSADAALLVTLAPGGYSAQVQGNNHGGGQVIVEVYEVK